MRLYFAPRTHATRARWLLEELEVPYDLVTLDLAKQENRTTDYLAVSPLGEVAALVDGDVTLLEPAAIALYLADRSAEKKLAPLPGSDERGPYYQWLLFAESTLAPVVTKLYEHAQLPAGTMDGAEAQGAVAAHLSRLGAVLDVVGAAIDGTDFLVAGRFTAADLSMASILHLANHLKLLDGRPRLVEYVYLHCKRPASGRAVSMRGPGAATPE